MRMPGPSSASRLIRINSCRAATASMVPRAIQKIHIGKNEPKMSTDGARWQPTRRSDKAEIAVNTIDFLITHTISASGFRSSTDKIAGTESQVRKIMEDPCSRKHICRARLGQDPLGGDNIQEALDSILVSFQSSSVRPLGGGQKSGSGFLLAQSCLHIGVSGPNLHGYA